MKIISPEILSVLAVSLLLSCTAASAVNTNSIYTDKPKDPQAVFFTPECFNFSIDKNADVSQELQMAVNKVATEQGFGILFIPEGKYRISRTIYIPKAVRLIGYGKSRPEFILTKNSPGFSDEYPNDKGKSKYMFWFTASVVTDENHIPDANAGTFYSGMSNINITIEDGNPQAVALRTHYAQHSFVSYMTVNAGKAKAGLFDNGNEMENVKFIGGEYGVMTTKASPGWQVMVVDCAFEGQRKAAIKSQEGGMVIVNLQVKNVPTVFQVPDEYTDRLLIDKGIIENVSGPAFDISTTVNSNNGIALRDVCFKNVPYFFSCTETGEKREFKDKCYKIKRFDVGLQMDSLTDDATYRSTMDVEPLTKMPASVMNDLPQLPDMTTWVSVLDFGAKGDGVSDDTEAIEKAIESADNIYFPTGWYMVSNTLKMKPHTKFIALHPFATQLKINESTPAFSGFGKAVAMLESSEGGDNYLNGIGINTGGFNYRAVGVKWMAGADSYINDVKFVGGHGTMARPPYQPWVWRKPNVSSPDNPVYAQGFDHAWDNQHWSLWITRGGGTFKDIWTANTYATSGVFISDTKVHGRIYAMSIEHHVREEVRMRGVANWKIYCMQTEEEGVESIECQPIEMDDCENITFANLYMFRVIRVNRPYFSSVRTRNCRNIEFLNVHNYAQVKFSNDYAIYDQSKDIALRPWEVQKVMVKGDEYNNYVTSATGTQTAVKIAGGFEFAEGLAHDSKGNIYFVDHRQKRLYRWSPEKGLSLLADFPWKPNGVGVDTEDNLLVTFRYDPQPGFEGETADVSNLPDSHGTSFSGWGNSGFATMVYTLDPENPEESIRLLDLVPMGQVQNVAKALYPSNRWRDFHDFKSNVVFRPEKCFLAPDGKTIIPQQYDLVRCSSLLEAVPGKPFYLSDDYDRRVVKTDVTSDGSLFNLEMFINRGEFGLAEDSSGNIYVAEGDVLVYSPQGDYKTKISVPERPAALTIVGNILYITARSGLYKASIEL